MAAAAAEIIEGTNFNIQFVLEQIARNVNGTNGNGINGGGGGGILENLGAFESINISDGNAFMSTILRLVLKWKTTKNGSTNPVPNSIVMKVPGPKHQKLMSGGEKEEPKEADWQNADSHMKFIYDFLIGAHSREIRFYTYFPQLDGNLCLPKFYYGADYHPSHRNGLILMEDLTPWASTVPVLPGFNDAKVMNLLTEMARIHSASWRNPDVFKQIFPNGTEYGVEAQGLIEGMKQNANKLKEFDAATFGTLVDRVLPLFTEQNCKDSSYGDTKFGIPPCIVHGDLYAPNILWQKDADGQISDRLGAIIDWQMIHMGNPCEDLCRMLALNTSGEYRRENTQRLLAFYAAEVAKFMDGKVPFTFDQLKVAYKKAMPFTMMFLCYGMAFYHDMDSIVGADPVERAKNQRELRQRCQFFLEDTAEAAGI